MTTLDTQFGAPIEQLFFDTLETGNVIVMDTEFSETKFIITSIEEGRITCNIESSLLETRELVLTGGGMVVGKMVESEIDGEQAYGIFSPVKSITLYENREDITVHEWKGLSTEVGEVANDTQIIANNITNINHGVQIFMKNIKSLQDPQKDLERLVNDIYTLGEAGDRCLATLIDFTGDNIYLLEIKKNVSLFASHIGEDSPELYDNLYNLVNTHADTINMDNFIAELVNGVTDFNVPALDKFSTLSQSEELYQKLKEWLENTYEKYEENKDGDQSIAEFIQLVGNTPERKKELEDIYKNKEKI